MNLELVEFRTEDGLRLPGGFFAPAVPKPGAAIDAVLVMTGTFYQDLWTELATALSAAGYPTLTAGARTFAVVWLDLHTGIHHGSAFQSMAEMVIDYTAAIGYLKSLGYQRIALYGHSIGGARVLYYAAHNPDPALKAVISSAGPSYNEASYLSSPRKDEFLATKADAQALVAAGRARDLVTFNFPSPGAILCAESWLGTYCSGAYDVGAWAANIKVPMLRIECGEETAEKRQLIDGVADLLFELAPNPSNKLVTIPGADHHFVHEFPAACREVVSWLDSLPA